MQKSLVTHCKDYSLLITYETSFAVLFIPVSLANKVSKVTLNLKTIIPWLNWSLFKKCLWPLPSYSHMKRYSHKFVSVTLAVELEIFASV